MHAAQARQPATTSGGEALRLLGETVPRVIEAGAEAARCFERGEVSLIEMLSHESRMRDLVGEVVAAHAREGTRTGFRNEDFEVLGRNDRGVTTAYAPMAFCPESALIVHAPIMLGRVCAIALAVLGGGETPIGFENVRLRRPVRHNLRILLAGDDDLGSATREGEPAIEGLLVTDHGKRHGFAAYELADEPVTGWIDNAVLDACFGLERPQSGHALLRASIAKPPAALLDGYLASLADAVELLLEVMIRAVVVTRNADGRGLLLGTVKSAFWPSNLLARLRGGMQILVEPRPSSKPLSDRRWRRLPVSCRALAEPAEITAELLLVEGRVTLGSIFA